MIYTVTPNPALDLGGEISELVPDEKMYVRDETWFPGGNAVNAARLLKTLAYPVLATGFLGGGTGEELQSLLERERVRCRFVRIPRRTRVSVTVTSRSTGRQTRLSFPGPRIRRQDIGALFSLVARAPSLDLLVTPDGSWFGKGPRVKVRSQVGAGDSMVAAMCGQLWRLRERAIRDWGEHGEALLRQGLAAATATLTTPGTRLGTREQVRAYAPRVQVERVA